MKKWIIIGAILICCILYALIKFSKPQDQNKTGRAENTTIEERADIGDTNKAPLAENSGSNVPADQVEAVIKAFEKFQNCLKDEDYQQAWELTSEHFKSEAVRGGFEGFKEVCDQIGLATVTVRSESAVVIDNQVGLLITGPSLKEDLYLFFIEEDVQWRLYIGQEARDVPR